MRRHLVCLLASLLATTAACKGSAPCASSSNTPSGADNAKNGSATAGAADAARTSPASAGAPSADAATRAVVEADIVQLDDEQDRIYAMSRNGTLAIVDASQPGALSLLGKTTLVGTPFEMYRRGDVLLTMSNGAVKGDGSMQVTLSEDAAPLPPDEAAGAVITAVDVKNPGAMTTLATFKVPGEIADSRIVGSVLYLATYENTNCWGCSSTAPRTLVTTFDISDAKAPKQVDQVSFDGTTGGGFNAAWSTPWKRSIIATASRMYVGGLAADGTTTTDEGVIEVLDITDPTGHLTRGAKITMAGPVMSRWQMDETDGVLRVVSQRGAGRTQNGDQYPDLDTFRVESSTSVVRLGHTTVQLPRQEGLKTVRFDGARAYAITFNQTDPLFTFDLSNPAQPTQKGELSMPGWVYYLEPRGDRLYGLGLDRTDQTGNLNVSLFDVADLAHPSMLSRVSFGPTNMYEDYQITNGVLAEDQDRIQKSFRIFSDGLLAVPYSSGTGACNGTGSGVELIGWTRDSLTKRALLPINGNPRRAVRRDSNAMKELIAISDSNVRSFSINQPDVVQQTADVTIGTCVLRDTPYSSFPFNEGNDVMYGDDYRPMGDDTPTGRGRGDAYAQCF